MGPNGGNFLQGRNIVAVNIDILLDDVYCVQIILIFVPFSRIIEW